MSSDRGHAVSEQSFGSLLRQYRQAAGLTQERLAERAGLSPRGIRALEHGERESPYETTVELLVNALGLAGAERAEFEEAAARRVPNEPTTTTVAPTSIQPSIRLHRGIPLVGRENELDAILDRLAAAQHGRQQLVLLEAEAGMGKTRLLAEVAHEATRRGALVLAGGSYRQEGHLPYGPLHDVLLDYVRAQPDAVLRRQLAGIAAEVARIVPEVRERLPAPSEAAAREGEEQRLQLYVAVTRLLHEICRDRPLLLLLDDLHWADNATLHLLHYLSRHLETERLLIVGAYRPEETSDERSVPAVAEIAPSSDSVALLRLEPFGLAQLKQILEARLGDACSEGLAQLLHARSAGNPLFALQIVRLLTEEHKLEVGDDGLQLVAGADVTLPQEVRGTVAERLRGLAPEARSVLSLGAILGYRFPYDSLEAAWEGDRPTLVRALEQATGAFILAETGTGYTFRHPILYEVILDEIAWPRRTHLHERVGLALEGLNLESTTESILALAHHFALAGPRHAAKAADYLLLAGDRIGGGLDWSQAAHYYQRAARLTPDARMRAAATEKLGRTLNLVARYSEALAALETAADLYRQRDDVSGLARAHAGIGAAYFGMGRALEGIRDLEAILPLIEGNVDDSELFAVHSTLANLYHASGQFQKQQTAAERVLELAGRLDDNRANLGAQAIYGLALINLGRLAEAATLLDHLVPELETAGEQDALIQVLNNLAWVSEGFGELERARRHLQRAMELAWQRGNAPNISFRLQALARNAYIRGDWVEALRLAERADAFDRESGRSWASPFCRLTLGRVCLGLGDGERGEVLLAEAADLSREDGNEQVLLQVQTLLAEQDLAKGAPDRAHERLTKLYNPTAPPDDVDLVRLFPALALTYLALGHDEIATEMARDAVDLARKLGLRRFLVDALLPHARVLRAVGQAEDAEDSFSEAARLAHEMSYPFGEARSLLELATCAATSGQTEVARGYLRDALSIFHKLGAREHASRTERLLTELEAAGS